MPGYRNTCWSKLAVARLLKLFYALNERIAINLMVGACLGFLLLLAGCTGLQSAPQSQTKAMSDTYQRMATELSEAPKFATYERYLSQELMEQIHAELSGDLDQQVEFLAPQFWFDAVTETHQGQVEGRSCLVVNGISVDGDLISAALEYVDQDDMMKIRAVEIGLYEPEESLSEDLWCPVRADKL